MRRVPDSVSLTPRFCVVHWRRRRLNIPARHADAKHATVSLKAEDGAVVLRVRDDGRGLPAELPKGTAGLGGMRERALLVGGRLTIDSDPERGSQVKLEVPGGEARA